MSVRKILGTIIVAAVILGSVFGATTASATTLCSNSTSTNKCTAPYGSGTILEKHLVSGTKSKLTTEIQTVECNKSTASGKIENGGSSTTTVGIKLGSLNFTECNCTVIVLKLGSLELHWITGTDNGTITGNGTELTTSCSTVFGTVHCIYVTSNTDLGTLVGGSPAKYAISSSLPRAATDALCSATATWTAEYEITAPKPLFVAAG